MTSSQSLHTKQEGPLPLKLRALTFQRGSPLKVALRMLRAVILWRRLSSGEETNPLMSSSSRVAHAEMEKVTAVAERVARTFITATLTARKRRRAFFPRFLL